MSRTPEERLAFIKQIKKFELLGHPSGNLALRVNGGGALLLHERPDTIFTDTFHLSAAGSLDRAETNDPGEVEQAIRLTGRFSEATVDELLDCFIS